MPRYIMKMPNNITTDALVAEMRKHLTSEYKIRLRGSSLNWEKMKADGYTRHEYKWKQDIGCMPLRYCREVRVYIERKKK